ncbi:MAG: VCBS repeat-containing protein [Thermotogae bacterium]|nr:VCBS repeat-containing protein [Thermotogota bacterium]
MLVFLVSQSVVQSDWSGGAGVCSTVSSWNNTFCSATPYAFYSFPGKLRLKGIFKTLREYSVDNSIGGWDNDPDIVDMDLDGDNDLLVSDESGPDVVYWYENSGCGGFARHTIESGVESVDEVVAVDYQHDGDMDVFAAAHPTISRDLILYRNDGGMSFSAHTIDPNVGGGSEAEGVDAGDLDGDGDYDVAVTWLAGGLWWYENTGSGWTKHGLGTGLGTSYDVVIGDYDNDGDNDIAMATRNALRIFRNDGGGTFTQVVVDNSLSDGYGLAKGDADGDGDYDLALTDRSGKVYLYRNDGGLSFTRITVDNSASRPMGIQLADFEPDGDLDIAVADQNAQRIYIYINGGSLIFTKTTPSISTRHYFGVGIGDLNSDASPDILVRAGLYSSPKEGLWWYKTVLQYYPNATLTSSPLDAGVYREWQEVRVQFSNCNPSAPGKEIHVYVRVSRYGSSWTPWIGPYVFTGSGSQNLYQPSIPLSDTFTEQHFRFLQYRIELYASTDSTLSPILDEIEFVYDPLNEGDDLGVVERKDQNPKVSLVGRKLLVRTEGRVKVVTSDGRLLFQGDDQLNVSLKPGIYWVVLENDTRRVIVR